MVVGTYANKAALRAVRRDPNVESVEVDEKREITGRSKVRGSIRRDESAEIDEKQELIGLLQVGALSQNSSSKDLDHRYLATGMPYGVAMVQAENFPKGQTLKTACVIDSGYYVGHGDLPPANGYNGNLQWDQDGDGHGTRKCPQSCIGNGGYS